VTGRCWQIAELALGVSLATGRLANRGVQHCLRQAVVLGVDYQCSWCFWIGHCDSCSPICSLSKLVSCPLLGFTDSGLAWRSPRQRRPSAAVAGYRPQAGTMHCGCLQLRPGQPFKMTVFEARPACPCVGIVTARFRGLAISPSGLAASARWFSYRFQGYGAWRSGLKSSLNLFGESSGADGMRLEEGNAHGP